MDHYTTLGLTPEASEADIRAAYRSLAQKYHPDKNRGDPSKFLGVKEAYEVLSDAARRSAYDTGKPTDPVEEARRNAAMRDLALLVGQIIEQCPDLAQIDFMHSIRSTLARSSAVDADLRARTERKIAKMELVVSRLSVESGENLVASIMEANIARERMVMAQIEEREAIRSVMLESVANASYTVPPSPATIMGTYFVRTDITA